MDRDKQLILSLLSALGEDANTTQSSLATQLGVGVGLVNSYMKRVIYKGYVKTTRLERRRLRYLLTPSGIKEKSRLTMEFLQYSYQYMRDVRARIHEILKPHIADGAKNVVIYGSGEVAELAYLALTELGTNLHAIVDEESKGERLLKYTIEGIDWLADEENYDLLLVVQAPKRSDDKERLHAIAETQGIAMEEFGR